jgi:pimeloyl-ACP methyl ester carboxylesterase
MPVVFLHGWPDSSFSFSLLLPYLPDEIRALVLDQRGFGDSDRPEREYGLSDFAGDVAAFLDAVSIERATVVGHSFGSFVARQVAISHPERVRGLVLIGTGFRAANAVTREVQASIRDLPDQVPRDFVREFQASTAHLPVPGPFFERVVAESQKAPARVWRAVFDNLLAHSDVAELARVRTPALVLWGDRDGLFPRGDQDQVVAALPGATLKVYPETGHCPNWERPQEVAADIEGFVRHVQAS